MTDDEKTTWDRFHDTVNMTARELERWLGTEESKSVGQKQGGGERLSATPSAIWRNAPTAR